VVGRRGDQAAVRRCQSGSGSGMRGGWRLKRDVGRPGDMRSRHGCMEEEEEVGAPAEFS